MASSLSLIIIAGLVVYLTYLQIKIAKFSRDRNDKIYVRILIAFFLVSNLHFYISVDVRFPLDLILIIGYGAMIAFFYGFHLIYKFLLRRDGVNMRDIDVNFQNGKQHLHEFLRKFFHFFVFGGTLLYLIIYNTITMELIANDPNFGAYVRSPWEDIPLLAQLNIDFVYDSDLYYPTPVELSLMTFYMIALPFAIIVEYFRLNPNLGIPLHALFVKSLRPSEQHNAAHYYFFIFGLFISSVFLPAVYVFGILCILCFGDTFASIVGKRIGKHKIPWESEKSWEGALAGMLITIITAYFFVGIFLSILLGLIFISIDIVTPYKLKVSDNFLYPLISLGVLLIFAVIQFPIDALFDDIFTFYNNWYISHSPGELIYS